MLRQIEGREKKIVELQSEVSDHERVLETLKDVPQDRKCFRLIGGVLVERTVTEVTPAVQARRDQIAAVVENLGGALPELRRRASKLQVNFVKT